MMNKVYIQFWGKQWNNGLPMSINQYAAYDGFFQRGDREVISFNALDDLKHDLTKKDIVCAGIGTIHEAWKHLGISIPASINYPQSLRKYLFRQVKQTTVGAIREEEIKKKRFIKPYDDGFKTFTGYVLRSTRNLFQISNLEDSVKLWESDVMHFQSEWRVFVLRGLIMGISHYNVNPLIFPDRNTIESMIKDYEESKEAPVAYGLDVGVNKSGQTVLVEVNDSYALGCYGLPSTTYAQMIEERWKEIVGS